MARVTTHTSFLPDVHSETDGASEGREGKKLVPLPAGKIALGLKRRRRRSLGAGWLRNTGQCIYASMVKKSRKSVMLLIFPYDTGGSVRSATGLGWLRLGMFHHPDGQ